MALKIFSIFGFDFSSIEAHRSKRLFFFSFCKIHIIYCLLFFIFISRKCFCSSYSHFYEFTLVPCLRCNRLDLWFPFKGRAGTSLPFSNWRMSHLLFDDFFKPSYLPYLSEKLRNSSWWRDSGLIFFRCRYRPDVIYNLKQYLPLERNFDVSSCNLFFALGVRYIVPRFVIRECSSASVCGCCTRSSRCIWHHRDKEKSRPSSHSQ